MNLYINTSGKTCQLALFNQSKLINSYENNEPMQHSRILHTAIDNLLSDANTDLHNLSSVGVMNGPGSYTGLRVGLAAAKTYCYGLDIPLVLFNKLELACDYYLSQHSEYSQVICLEHARASEFFCCMKDKSQFLIQPNVYQQEEIHKLLKPFNNRTYAIVTTVKADNLTETFDNIQHFEIPITYIGNNLYNALIGKEYSDIFRSEPFYLKKVHANAAKSKF